MVAARARQSGTLRHATGKLVWIRVIETGKPNQLQRFVNAVGLRATQSPRLQSESYIPSNGSPGIKRRILKNHHARRVRPLNPVIVDEQIPGAGTVEPSNQTEQS